MLVAYADAIARESGQTMEVSRLVAPMLARFMAADRAFLRLRRSVPVGSSDPGRQ